MNDQNYFVASLYMCLVPQSFMYSDLNQQESARSPSKMSVGEIEDIENSPNADSQQVIVTDREVRGYLQKTAQDLGMFQRSKFLTRYYVLNADGATISVGDSENDKDPSVIEIRRNKLVRVETNLYRELPDDYPKNFKKAVDIALPNQRTEPIGLVFEDGSIILLWAKPGKEFKVWTRSF